MSRIDQLIEHYRGYVTLPLRPNLPLSQRVWFLVYAPEDERRMANKIPEFEILTRDAGLSWHRIDLAGAFADWMDSLDPDEREACLADPDLAENYADPGLSDFLSCRIQEEIAAIPPGEVARTVTALTGLMDLYDFIHVSALIESLGSSFPGVLLLFFPGERVGTVYRFLNARDGWNYLAVPILAES